MDDIEIYSTIGCRKWSPAMLDVWLSGDAYVTVCVTEDSGEGVIRLDKEAVTKLVTGLQGMLENMKG